MRNVYSDSYNKIVVLVCCFFFGFCSEKPLPQQFKYYADGKKLSSFYLNKNEEMEGEYFEYFPSGKVRLQKIFVKNLEEGKATHYYESGKLREVQFFVHGKKNGADTLFDESGKIRNISNFLMGQMHGTFHKFKADSDSLDLESVYVRDSLISVKKHE